MATTTTTNVAVDLEAVEDDDEEEEEEPLTNLLVFGGGVAEPHAEGGTRENTHEVDGTRKQAVPERGGGSTQADCIDLVSSSDDDADDFDSETTPTNFAIGEEEEAMKAGDGVFARNDGSTIIRTNNAEYSAATDYNDDDGEADDGEDDDDNPQPPQGGDPDEDEDILADFAEDDDDDDDDDDEVSSFSKVEGTISGITKTTAEAETFRADQELLHASTTLVMGVQQQQQQQQGALPPTTDHHEKNNNNNKNLMLCLACGANLSHIKSGYQGRLNHIKRCSKSRGVTVKDLMVNGHDDVDDDNNDDEVEPTGATSAVPAKAWSAAESATAAAATGSPKVRTLHEMLMAGARRAAKTEQIKKRAKTQGRYNNNSQQTTSKKAVSSGGGGTIIKRSYTKVPSFKMIPGTDFCVDGFQYAHPALTSQYFLTHFHADHYGGIDKHWCAGTIYCNSITATLVQEQLRVDPKYLHVLPMHEPTVLASRGSVPITVTLLHANHCPGAVMMLFEVKDRTILHVGDFRWNYAIMSAQAPLRSYCRPPWSNNGTSSVKILDELFLDTTYCNPKYDLPTPAECIRGAVEKAVKEVEEARVQKQRLLMLFGSYTIGKEAVRLFWFCDCPGTNASIETD
jgi:hypothetical protein